MSTKIEENDPNETIEMTKAKVEEDLEPSKPSQSLNSPPLSSSTAHPFFHFMARMPLPFLVLIPVAFAFLIGFGWQTNDKVETEVANLWIAQDGDYAADQEYARNLGSDDLSSSSFPAIAVSRDGKNIMTESRLEEIRSRMEATEATTIEYKGVTYNWDDLCGVNSAPYQFPCLRYSPMDMFAEARWTFLTFDRVAWFRNIVQKLLIGPRLGRFGVLTNDCQQECIGLLILRAQNPIELFADIGNMEFNHPCRMCIEEKYPLTVEQLYAGIAPSFGVLSREVLRYSDSLEDTEENAATKKELQDIAGNLGTLITSITKDDVVDFYSYYVTRGLYAQLGAGNYLAGYEAFDPLIQACIANKDLLNTVCPEPYSEMTEAKAQAHLAKHADSTTFSGANSAGAPFPFWADRNGMGAMFGKNAESTLFPVSGSGIDMSASIFSLVEYLDLTHYTNQTAWNPVYTQGGFADPSSPEWQAMVDTNPIYAWFMASLTPADTTTLCNNDQLNGTDTISEALNNQTTLAAAAVTQSWCTNFNVPNPNVAGSGGYSKQHFARMWYDLLMGSPGFLDVVQGQDDPYSWTTGSGCGYDLGGGRFSYTGQSESDILGNASREVYNIDEGATLGPVDRNILIGGASPPVGEYNFDNPLKEVKVMQTLYAALVPKDIVTRVKNCNRPNGPLDITFEDAENILGIWKEAMEDNWSYGWDNDDFGEVQFVSFFDDGGGVIGSTGRMLEDITLDNSKLTAISIACIAIFSALFLFSFDAIESRILITLFGVGLVVMSFFAALGFGLLVGTKINVTIAWTLPFVIIGLGVDDVYIILLSIKKQGGYTEDHWQKAMKEVVVPVTMTSLVNVSMFAVLNVSDVPAVYLTAQVACYCVIGLYLSVIFCFPAWCYLDLKRQEAGRMDVLFCVKSSDPVQVDAKKVDFRETYLYDCFYKRIVFGELRYVSHFIIAMISLALFAVGSWGITEREIGLGLEDFFPDTNPAGRWATLRTEELASWSVGINWGALDYTDQKTQMKMIKQFEDIVTSPHIAEIDTKQLWMANFLIWTSRHCSENFDRQEFENLECGRDKLFVEEPNSYCAGSWASNEFDLREKFITSFTDQTCRAFEGGICRPGNQMHPLDLAELGLDEESAKGMSFCPVVKEDWSDEKWQFCLQQWRIVTGGSGRLIVEKDSATNTSCSGVYQRDGELRWPIPFSAGPTMFAFDLFSHQDTLDMMEQTSTCDDDDDLHCWMSGIPFDYWTQYQDIFQVLIELSAYATAAGFGIAFLFLLGTFTHEGHHSMVDIVGGSFIGAFLIAMTMILSLVTVVGLSILVDVNLTGFSNMSFVLSVGFAVEYSVHIVSRWMRADMSHSTSLDRAEHTMSFLMLPTFMSFVSSTIGVVCLAFTEFEFNKVFFFKPLIIVMFVSYWYGCWFLPVLLSYLDFDMVKLGKPAEAEQQPKVLDEGDSGDDIGQEVKGDVDSGDSGHEAKDVALESSDP